jgi:hypothetical protein
VARKERWREVSRVTHSLGYAEIHCGAAQRIRSEAFTEPVGSRRVPPMSIITDVDAFYLEHERCGDLDGEVSQEEQTIRVWMSCTCGALFNRVISMKEGGPTKLR